MVAMVDIWLANGPSSGRESRSGQSDYNSMARSRPVDNLSPAGKVLLRSTGLPITGWALLPVPVSLTRSLSLTRQRGVTLS